MQTVPVLLLLVSRLLLAQASPKPVAAAQGAVSGRWTVNADFYGVATYNPLTLEQQGEKLTGDFGGDKLEGTFSGNAIHFLAKDDEGGTEELQDTVQGGVMSGTIVFADAGSAGRADTRPFTAARVPQRAGGPPRRDQQGPPENAGATGEVIPRERRDLTRLACSDKVRPLPRGGAAW
jgi:amidase